MSAAHPMPSPFDYLHDPRLNKGTGFTEAERDALRLRGLLPPRVTGQAEQEARILENFRLKANPLEQYIYLISLMDRNEHLFYRTVIDHIIAIMTQARAAFLECRPSRAAG